MTKNDNSINKKKKKSNNADLPIDALRAVHARQYLGHGQRRDSVDVGVGCIEQLAAKHAATENDQCAAGRKARRIVPGSAVPRPGRSRPVLRQRPETA